MKPLLSGLILWGKEVVKQPEEAKLFQVTCAMEKQNLSRGRGEEGALSKDVDRRGWGRSGLSGVFFYQTPVSWVSVHSPPHPYPPRPNLPPPPSSRAVLVSVSMISM